MIAPAARSIALLLAVGGIREAQIEIPPELAPHPFGRHTMRIAMSIIGLLLAAGTAPTAIRAEPSGQNATRAGGRIAQDPVKPSREKLICRREQASETRLRSVRICLTADEWKAKDRRSS